ncbi:MAG TPA: sulfatase [Thermoanaerobaculia bacterium]|nr:sulfatase [Thermoanaerobaculia bacterium]
MSRPRRLSTAFDGLTLGLVLAVLGLAACAAETEPRAATLRLVDLFAGAEVAGSSGEEGAARERLEWTFAAADAPGGSTRGWEPHGGVAGLRVLDGKLVGRSTSPMPLLHLERDADPADSDPLHAVEVRARVSAGANLAVAFARDEEPPLEQLRDVLDIFPWGRSPVTPGEELVTYTLTSPASLPASSVRHIYLRPTDAAGAEFAIESIRLVFRAEHLASIPSGVSWQGLGEVYRESLVSRAPETMRFALELPDDGWLDLGLGTVESRPLTFRVSLESGATSAELLERTITTPEVWHPAAVDLAAWAGRRVTLELAVESDAEGTIGIWGSPAVRGRGGPATSAEPPRLAGGTAEPPQGIILIMMDTLRADHLSPWGYGRETAPTLQRMAERGVRFADTQSQGTWTKVAAPSILTSLYPTTHTVASFYDRLPAAATTLAEVYREAGHATLSLSSVLFTGRFTNLHQGFEELHEQTSLPDEPSKDGIKSSRPYVDRLLPWIERHRDSPFFVFFHATDPHDPFEPREPFDTRWVEAGAGEAMRDDQAKLAEVIRHPLMRLFMMPNREELEAAGVDPETYVEREIGWYDGSILGFDVELRRLNERLRELGLEERTLIAFVSDHGEEFLEHGAHFHGQSVYGELTHVPLLLYWPGTLPEGVVIEETVQSIDLMPTLLELCGLEAPGDVQGQSLVPLIAASGDAAAASRAGWRRRPAIAEKADTSGKPGGNPAAEALEAYAIVSEGWRLIHNVANRGDRPELELYDHVRDPLNLENVAERHPDVMERLAGQLEAWRRTTLASRLDPAGAGDASLTAEEMARLRALGYL